jgi:hypothetical protein
MTSPLHNASVPSRRALLASAVGGIGALAASAIARPRLARAHDAEDVRLAGDNSETTTTTITNSTTSDPVMHLDSSVGMALYATSGSGTAIEATSDTGLAVYGVGSAMSGVRGDGFATDQPAVLGWSFVDGTGVQGHSSSGNVPPAPRANTGVYGYGAQDTNSKGVFGESPAGWGGFFIGKVYTSKFHEMPEIATPSAPNASRARLFVRDNGTGKTQLCVRFNTGAIQVLATQP